MERHAPLKQRLVRGRVCSHELCAVDNCALHLRDEVVLPTEADSLVEHGQLVLDAEDAASQQDTNQKAGFGRSRRVDFVQSVTYGSHGGHLLCLRIVERLRRIAASAFNLPITRLLVAEHFLTLRQAGPSLEPVAHCDEAVFPHGEGVKGRWRFHFSAVLWLNDAGRDFDGGELAFYRASATEKAPDDFTTMRLRRHCSYRRRSGVRPSSRAAGRMSMNQTGDAWAAMGVDDNVYGAGRARAPNAESYAAVHAGRCASIC